MFNVKNLTDFRKTSAPSTLTCHGESTGEDAHFSVSKHSSFHTGTSFASSEEPHKQNERIEHAQSNEAVQIHTFHLVQQQQREI